MSTLKNKTAVITGGNSGMGYAAAEELLAQGANVVITGRNEVNVASASATLNVTGIVSDQANLKAIDQLAADVQAKFGKVDILFINAGIASFTPIDAASEEDYDSIMNINFKGAYFTVQKFLPLLNDGASIIFNASVMANLGMPNSSIYSASKAALLAITRVLATELAPRKIRVNAISPGPIQTPIYEKVGLSNEEIEGFATLLEKKVLLNRFGTSQEISKAVKFLASEDSSFITGTEIIVDGGIVVNAVLN